MGLLEILDGRFAHLPFKKRRKIIEKVNYFRSIGKSSDLNFLATLYKTDKWGKHFYTQHYKNHFLPFRNQRINLLEIGVGGYDDPHQGGGSLRMWKRFFSKGKIYSIDIQDKSLLQENRIRIFQGSQVDVEFLDKVVGDIGELDLIIDDGSHLNEHVITTFKHLFPKLKTGGIYVIEDVQTSYWPSFFGDSVNLNNLSTSMGFFKSLTDGLNFTEFKLDDYQPTYYDKNIVSMHFYHNLIFIHKGQNNEPSNIPK